MKGLKTKKQIIKKAIELFYKNGFANTSIRDIVREVGITNSTVYLYFKSKEELLYTIIYEIGETLLNELNQAISNNNDPLSALKEMIYRQVCLIKSRRMEIKIYLEEQYQLNEEYKEKALKQHRKIYDLYYNTIVNLKKKGLLRDVDPTVATFSIFALMNWSYRWFKEEGRLTIEDIANEIISIFFNGILK